MGGKRTGPRAEQKQTEAGLLCVRRHGEAQEPGHAHGMGVPHESTDERTAQR